MQCIQIYFYRKGIEIVSTSHNSESKYFPTFLPNVFLLDNFNVADKNSKHNFFMNYSVQGKQHPRSYMYQMKKRGVLYSFIGIDACLEPGEA